MLHKLIKQNRERVEIQKERAMILAKTKPISPQEALMYIQLADKLCLKFPDNLAEWLCDLLNAYGININDLEEEK